MEVLAAFIREHSHQQWPPLDPSSEQQKRSTRPDIQAALTVIGRCEWRREYRRERRSRDVTRIDLTDANLTGATFFGNLSGARLLDAHLQGVILVDAHLDNAILNAADLSEG